MLPDEIVTIIHELYDSIKFTPPPGQFTILASFYLFSTSSLPRMKIISMATGMKCLPTARLPMVGEALYDSHAEVLSRRGALRWFLEEIQRMKDGGVVSDWLQQTVNESGGYKLKEGVEIGMYVSTVPCEWIQSISLSLISQHKRLKELQGIYQAETRQCVFSRLSRIQRWLYSKILLLLLQLKWTQIELPEDAIITPYLVCCARNLGVRILLRRRVCRAVIRSHDGVTLGSKALSDRISSRGRCISVGL